MFTLCECHLVLHACDDEKPICLPADQQWQVMGLLLCTVAAKQDTKVLSLFTKRVTTLGFVECSTCWHVDIVEWWTLILVARQLTRSHIPWHIPSMSHYRRTSKSVWSSLALCSRQTRVALWAVLSAKRLCKYFTISRCTSGSFVTWQQRWMSLVKELGVSSLYSYLSDSNMLLFSAIMPIYVLLFCNIL